jgi:hypothetical protein
MIVSPGSAASALAENSWAIALLMLSATPSLISATLATTVAFLSGPDNGTLHVPEERAVGRARRRP